MNLLWATDWFTALQDCVRFTSETTLKYFYWKYSVQNDDKLSNLQWHSMTASCMTKMTVKFEPPRGAAGPRQGYLRRYNRLFADKKMQRTYDYNKSRTKSHYCLTYDQKQSRHQRPKRRISNKTMFNRDQKVINLSSYDLRHIHMA